MRLVFKNAQVALAAKVLAALVMITLIMTGILLVIERPQDFLFPLQFDAVRAVAELVAGSRHTMSADTKPPYLDIAR